MIVNELHADPEVDAPPLAPSPQTAPQQEPKSTGVALRNRWFREQNEAKGTETYHSQATIRDKWNRMTKAQQAAICPGGTGNVSRATVIKGIERAT